MNKFLNLIIIPLIVFFTVSCNKNDDDDDNNQPPIESDYRNAYIGYYDCIRTGYFQDKNTSTITHETPIGLTVSVEKYGEDMIKVLNYPIQLQENLSFEYVLSPFYGSLIFLSGHFENDSIFITNRLTTDTTYTYHYYKGKKESPIYEE